MNNILDKNICDMPGLSFDCICGRWHQVDIKNIKIGSDILKDVLYLASEFKHGNTFLFSDSNTFSVCGSKALDILTNNGFNVNNFVFDVTDGDLIPDEIALGRLIMEMEIGTSLIIVVGSGTLNDLARIISSRTNIPYIIIGTAPSMDGYASVISPLIIDNFKRTFPGVYAHSIIGDVEIMKQAPINMVHAGFGDILGKMTALADWELSRQINDEYYCETCVSLVQNAIDNCINNIDGIIKRDGNAIKYLMEGLVYSGVAMGLAKDSRPASGAEHILAHYWEIDAISKGKPHALHGNAVGVATVVVSLIYNILEDRLPGKIEVVKPDELVALLKRVGANYSPASLGISKELFQESILEGWKIRPRYTILRFAQQHGFLEELADKLDKYFYN